MSTGNESSKWISLSEYSAEYGVSVSTLRRRIKSDQIQYKMINGKYYLPNKLMRPKAPSPVPDEGALVEATVFKEVAPKPMEKLHSGGETSMTQLLLEELKKAYLNSLQDKEKNIIQLKQQVADLQTLVLYLEKENKRLGSLPNLSR